MDVGAQRYIVEPEEAFLQHTVCSHCPLGCIGSVCHGLHKWRGTLSTVASERTSRFQAERRVSILHDRNPGVALHSKIFSTLSFGPSS